MCFTRSALNRRIKKKLMKNERKINRKKNVQQTHTLRHLSLFFFCIFVGDSKHSVFCSLSLFVGSRERNRIASIIIFVAVVVVINIISEYVESAAMLLMLKRRTYVCVCESVTKPKFKIEKQFGGRWILTIHEFVQIFISSTVFYLNFSFKYWCCVVPIIIIFEFFLFERKK